MKSEVEDPKEESLVRALAATSPVLDYALLLGAFCAAASRHSADALAALVLYYIIHLSSGILYVSGRPFISRFVRYSVLSATFVVYWNYVRGEVSWVQNGQAATYYIGQAFWVLWGGFAGGITAVLEGFRRGVGRIESEPTPRSSEYTPRPTLAQRVLANPLTLIPVVSAVVIALVVLAFGVPAYWIAHWGVMPWTNAGAMIPAFLFIFESLTLFREFGQWLWAMVLAPAGLAWRTTDDYKARQFTGLAVSATGFLVSEAVFVVGMAALLFYLPLVIADESASWLTVYVGSVPLALVFLWLLSRLVYSALMLSGLLSLHLKTDGVSIQVETPALAWYGPVHTQLLGLSGLSLLYAAMGYMVARIPLSWPVTLALVLALLLIGFLPLECWLRRIAPEGRDYADPAHFPRMLLAGAVYLAKTLSWGSRNDQGKRKWLTAIVVALTLAEVIPRAEILATLDDARRHLEVGQLREARSDLARSDRVVSALQMLHLPKPLVPWKSKADWDAVALKARADLQAGEMGRAYEEIIDLESSETYLQSNRDRIEAALLDSDFQTLLGDTLKADAAAARALAAADDALNGLYWTAYVGLRRAALLIDSGDCPDALRLLSHAERMGQRFGDYLLLSSSLGGKGDAYLALGDSERAEHYHSRALALAMKQGARGDQALYRLKLAVAQSNYGKSVEATKNCSESINLAERIYAPELRVQGLYQRGLIQEREGNRAAAEADYRRAVELVESLRGSLKGEHERRQYLARRIRVYERLVAISHACGDDVAAFNYAQRGKARALLDLIGTRMLSYRSEDRPLGDKEIELQWKIRALLDRIAEEEGKPTNIQSRELAEWRKELEQAQRQHQTIMATIRTTNPKLASIATVSTAGVSEVRNALRQDEALFDYYVTDQKTLLWVVTRSDFRCIDIPAGRHDLQHLVGQLRDSIEQGRGYDVKVAIELYRLLLQPGLSVAAGKPHLVIAPHDVLCSLPFEALVVDPNGPTYAGDRWVISEYESASVLALNRTHPTQPTRWRMSLLALGDPVFESNDERYTSERVQVAASPRNRGALLRRVTLDNSAKESGYQPWHRLPATGSEVTDIAALFARSDRADTMTGIEASEDAVKRLDHRKYRYEHFATHGALAGDVPGLREPALVLSLPKSDDKSSDDGYLTMTEVFGLRLNADLVTLSACNTRMGELVPGEGLVGMTRAFMYAGTPSVVASLWSVADESTSKLMVAFYRHLREGKSKSEALALAKRELRRIPQYSNPFYWAPFVLVGEG